MRMWIWILVSVYPRSGCIITYAVRCWAHFLICILMLMIRVRPPLTFSCFPAYHACASLFDLDPLWILRIKMQIKAKLASGWAFGFSFSFSLSLSSTFVGVVRENFNALAPPLDRHHSDCQLELLFDEVCRWIHFITYRTAKFHGQSLHLSGISFFLHVLNHFSIEKTIEKFCGITKKFLLSC